MVTSAAILAPFCAPLFLSAPPAGAAPSKLIVATGSITCRHLTGTITFTPPMHMHAGQMETTVISFHASACTTKGSNVPSVSGGSVTFTTHYFAVNGCGGLAPGGGGLSGTERWQPSSIAPSTVVLHGYARRANGGAKGLVYANTPGLQQVVVAPAPGEAVSVTGSFAGKASYVVQENQQGSVLAYTDRVTGQLAAECRSSAGLSVLNIVSGVEALP